MGGSELGARGGVLPDVSVVVPTFGGARSLPALCQRIARILDDAGLRWELLVVDDASPDDTRPVLAVLAAAQPRLRPIHLAVNRGQHAATLLGLREARGRVLITIDDDLQQAPESIPDLLAALDRGAQVAIARFARPAHPAWRRWGSRLLRRAMGSAPAASALAITSFKAFSRAAVERLLAAAPPTGRVYIGALLLQTIEASSLVNVDVPHHPRLQGRSGYGWRSLARLAWAALSTRARGSRP